jgi:hypothetical protein
MTHDEANEKYWEQIFADEVRKVAPTSAKVYSKLIMGLQAERDLFELKCEEMAAELARLKQGKMAGGKSCDSCFWLGAGFCAVALLTFRTLSVFVERGWIQ